MTRLITAAAALTLTLGLGVLPAGDAVASLAQSQVVSSDPANFTPNVESDATVSKPAVHALEQVGSTMYAGGAFATVSNSSRTASYQRHNIMAFSATNEALTSFAPQIDGWSRFCWPRRLPADWSAPATCWARS